MKNKSRVPIFFSIAGSDISWSPIDSRFSNLRDLPGLFEVFVEILNFLIGFSVLIAVVMLIIMGYLFITSSGDPENIAKAQKGLTGAIIGLVIVFLARAVILFILKEFLS